MPDRSRDSVTPAAEDYLKAVWSAQEWDETPVDLAGGWHVCLYDNLWGTNFPMWYEDDAKFRFSLRVPTSKG